MHNKEKNGDNTPDAEETLNQEGVPAEEFKATFRNHPAGVALITADAGHGPVALTATSVFSVSASPPLLIFAISEFSSRAATIHEAKTVVVHLLSAEHLPLAELGAASGIDRFSDTSLWSRLPTGEPYFPAVHTWIRGQIVQEIAAGGSRIVLLHAQQTHTAPREPAENAPQADPLVYHNRTWHKLDENSAIKEHSAR